MSRIGWLRAAVLRANDVIVSTASLIIGVAAASSKPSEILIAGAAGLVAGAMLMAVYAFGVFLVGAAGIGLAQRRALTRWPRGIFAWSGFVGFAVLGIYARIAYRADIAPAGHTLDLGSPLGPGTYLVANGGAASSVNAHAAWLDQSVAALRPYWGTAYGVDLVALNRWGLRADGLLPADPRATTGAPGHSAPRSISRSKWL